MASKTTVVIVNWNGAAFLKRLLSSVESCKPKEIIVVDNASTDGSVQTLSESPAKIITNSENLGFGSAANIGIETASTDYVLLLNVDTEVLPGSIDALEDFLDNHPAAAVAAPRLQFPDARIQPSCRRFPTPLYLFLYLSYLDKILPSSYRLPAKEHDHVMEVEQPMGAAMMFRKKALAETGAFDPRFFLYMEEVDLCERIKNHGWKIYFVPEARMIHHAGGSTAQDWERSQTHYFRSVLQYFGKRYSAAKMLFFKLSQSFALLIRSLVLLASGRLRQGRFYGRMAFQIFSLQ
jgi:N-acetylglucosaminyl-diphospho-decaprenol L-rhamnosyltransferase